MTAPHVGQPGRSNTLGTGSVSTMVARSNLKKPGLGYRGGGVSE
jgi:hypothetical protein